MAGRGGGAGGAPDRLHQGVAVVQGLAVDARHGHLYWCSEHSVEVSRLDGRRHHVLHTLPSFSGRHVVGVAVSYDDDRLFWLTKTADALLLHRTPLLRGDGAAATAPPRHVTHTDHIDCTTV